MSSPSADANVETPGRRGLGYFIVGTLLNVVVFVAVGPLVGCLVFMLLIAIVSTTPITAPFVAAYTLAALGLIAVPFAYVIGGPAAAATGALVAVASIWSRAAVTLYAVAALIGGGAGVMLAAYRWNQLDGAASVFFYFIVGAVAALICTRVARPFRLGSKEVAQ